jgi:superfamily II DNA or RNA helicase
MPRAALPAPDPFLLDADQLQALASPAIVRRGIAYFKENRVTELGWDLERLWAGVEGSRPGAYQVEIALDDDRELLADCDCPFDWEPVCKHVVATLLAYAARQPVTEVQAEGAAQAALEARVHRGRTEVKVRHAEGDPWLGVWEAWSLSSAGEGREAYRVQIRSVSDRINHCTCPDFAINRLGTCKHVEAVLHRLRKRTPRKFQEYALRGPPASFVHLDWSVPRAPGIRLRRAADGAPGWLDKHFDGEGLLRGSLPDAFHSLKRAARRGKGLVITPEAESYVRRLKEEAERQARAKALGRKILRSSGTMPEIDAHLYPYQVDGVAFLASTGRALLADDMGLGKTLQAIAAAALLREHEGVRRVLVVCPASLKHQWAREIHRFAGTEATVVEGPPSARLVLYRQRAPFTLVNYEVVLRDREVLQRELAPDLLILDEAQRIKNWRTKTAAAVKALDTRFAFVLTGTPLENRIEDLYSLMQVVDPRVLGPLWRCLLDFHVTDGRGRVLGYRGLSELRRRLAPVMLRRDRSLVRNQLPDRIDSRLDLDLDRRQRDLHDEAMSAAGNLARIAERRPLTPSEEKRLMAVLQTARMACNAAGLVDGDTTGSPKLTELASLLEELCLEGGRKAVVFSQWERMTKMAEEVARGLGLRTIRLHGGVPTPRRGELIDRFREDPGVQVFLSTDAGGVGLNLQAASVLINLDLPWNPAVLEQRVGRVHRLGQREPVQVVLMVSRNSYEERIAGLIEAKRELFRNVVGEDATEDVVGVSKKMVEVALSTLAEEGQAPEAAGIGDEHGTEDGPAPGVRDESPAETSATAAPPAGTPAVEEDASLAALVARLQAALGDRIERVVAAGGGLVAVADTVDPATEARVASIEGEVPVAVVDTRSWAALNRLGPGSPWSGGRVVFEAPQTPGGATGASAAERKLKAAEILADNGQGPEALSLATASMLLALAEAAGQPPPPPDRAAVWLYGEMVPKGFVAPEGAATISRGLALAAAQDVPPELVATVLADARSLLEDLR